MLYTVSNLTKVYQNRTVLDISQLQVDEGQIYALLGPNGAGKTTLLDILGFIAAPTAGTVAYRSRPVQYTESSLQLLRREVVIVEQHPIMFSTTVAKNIEFGLKIRNISASKRREIIAEVLDLVGMQEFDQAMAHRLSGGETQRVAIARALAVAPRVLLCDEPTSSVDVENQLAVTTILRRINAQKNITIIFTTHDRFQAATLAHQTLFLDHGRLSNGSADNLFSAELIGENSTNMACRIQDAVTLMLSADNLQKKTRNANGRVRVRIHPEMIQIQPSARNMDTANCYPGKIIQISQERERIHFHLDIGIRLSVIISQQEYQHRPLPVGSQVNVYLPFEAISLI